MPIPESLSGPIGWQKRSGEIVEIGIEARPVVGLKAPRTIERDEGFAVEGERECAGDSLTRNRACPQQNGSRQRHGEE